MIGKENIIKSFARKVGIDGAIAYSSSARIIQAAANFIVLFFIASLLSPAEQGFYYTFGSIAGIQVFFELGFTGIMTQYVAHEVVHLKLNDLNYYDGEDRYISRLSYLIRFCLKWYTVITVLFFIIVILVGFVFFSHYDAEGERTSWKGPWVLMSVATAIKLFQTPFNSILIGLGKIKEMNKVLFFQQLFIPSSLIIGLFLGMELYVVGASILVGVCIWFFYVLKSHHFRILYNLWIHPITEKISYMKEIFPYQWKIALSWISGYFIFQMFNPVLFATEGAVVAGQMGMTISILSGIQALALSWQNTKVPIYSGYIELKQFAELDRLFKLTTKQMLFVSFSLYFLFFALVFVVDIFDIAIFGIDLAGRVLEVPMLILMTIAVFLNQIIYSWATYLRCHKQEPFLVLSVVEGLACLLSTLLLGNLYGLQGIVIGYLLIIIVQTIWAYSIFTHKKNEWHG